jgi:hypothetical protein
MKRMMTQTLNVCKRSKGNPDIPHVPFHPRIYAEFAASDTEEHALSNIPLQWMVSEIGSHSAISASTKPHSTCGTSRPITTIERAPMTREVSNSTWSGEESELGPGRTRRTSITRASLAREASAGTSTSTSNGTPGRKGGGALSPLPPIEESPDAEDKL